MQTFLPMTQSDVDAIRTDSVFQIREAFKNIAKSLDNKRLFKQALEGWQILLNLLEIDPLGDYRKPKGWSSHPAVKMWRGSEELLAEYVYFMIMEWVSRGFKTTLMKKLRFTINTAISNDLNYGKNIPSWISDKDMLSRIASSHRLALLVKQYEHYNKFNWPEDTGTKPTSYEYVWPIKGGKYDSDEELKKALVTSS